MTAADTTRRRLLLPVLLLCITLPNIWRQGGFSAQAWPVWQPMLAAALLVMAGAALVAAIAAGVVNWRRRTDA